MKTLPDFLIVLRLVLRVSHLLQPLRDISQLEEAAKRLTETGGEVSTILAVVVEPVVVGGPAGGEESTDQDWAGGRH